MPSNLCVPCARHRTPSTTAAISFAHRAVLVAGMLMVATVGASRPSAAGTFYVGPDRDCDTNTLLGAVTAAAFTLNEDDEIRIVSAGFVPSQELRNFNPATIGALTISGGWADCTGTPSPARGFIQGDGTLDTLRVVADGAPTRITLRDLEITTSSGDPIRGISVTGGDAELRLENVRIRFHAGGGLSTSGPVLVVIDEYSEIAENDSGSQPGGGIACEGSTIILAGNLTNNSTTSNGGGAYLNGGCDLMLFQGAYVGGNSAKWGGGFAVSGSSKLRPDDEDGLRVMRILGNSAELEGGGIYAIFGAEVTLENTEVLSNTAGQRGAGIFADLGADVLMTSSVPCFSTFGCSKIRFNDINVTPSFREGTAVYVGGNSTVSLFQTRIDANFNVDLRGDPLFATGAGTLLNIEGATITGNNAESLFTAEDGATISAAFVSAAGNSWTTGSGTQTTLGATVSGSSTVEIFSSLLWDHGPFDVEAGSALGLDCAMVSNGTGTTTTRAVLVGVDPLFIDPANFNLRLGPGSLAIDYCDTVGYAPLLAGDLDNLPRGVDVADQPNLLGSYDLGAYEQFQQPLFFDGFESGDTTSWTDSLP